MAGEFSLQMTGTLAASTWDVAPAAGFIAVAFAAAGFLAMAWLWRSTAATRVNAGPASMELRDEPPAIVDLLTGGFQVEDDAVPATVIDLAARGHLAIEELGGQVTIRPRIHGGHQGEALTPYEQRVMTHINQHVVGGSVPAQVITIGPEGVSERWFKSFVREVNKDGQARGLCVRRFDLKHLAMAWGIVVLAAAPAWIISSAAPRTSDPRGWGSLGNLLVGVGFLAGVALAWVAQRITRSNAQRDTAAGREAATHWLGVRDHYRTVGDFDDKPAASVAIWDRHLAYATSMGLAPVVQRQLPFETEHDRHAWSRATGSWRRIKVRYQSFVPGWGRHPGRVAFEGLFQAAFAGAIAYGGYYVAGADITLDQLTDDQRRWIGLAGLIVAAVAAVICVFALIKLTLGVSDLFAKRTIEGELVRRRAYKDGHRLPKAVQWMLWAGRDEHGMRRDYNRHLQHHIAIDTGESDSILAFVSPPSIYQVVHQGARVRAIVTPRLGYVREIEVVAPARASAAQAPVVHHDLVTDVGARISGKLSGTISAAMSNLEHATDEAGRPLLDQPNDEGGTLREQLAERQDQLAKVRNDPRLKNSPIGGILDAFLGGTDAKPSARRDDRDDRGER